MRKKLLLFSLLLFFVVFGIISCTKCEMSKSTSPDDQIVITIIDGTEIYVNIKFKGDISDWELVAMDDSDGDHTWTVSFDIPEVEEDTSYEWGAIEDDGSEWGIWLIDGPNCVFTVHTDGSVTGQTTYEIPPLGGEDIYVTFQCDMNAEEISADGVHITGSFAPYYAEWDPGAIDCYDDGTNGDLIAEDGIYSVQLLLGSGVDYGYKFVNGNTWGCEELPGLGTERHTGEMYEDTILDVDIFGIP
ncbi:MAG: hypothetical protein KAT74_01620 [Candidatus Cloacimonetes bacterium]|nr:hypothetical protein [Candidatus Cloacimonadota bacterium]